MSVGILIITHDGIGAAISGTANFMLNEKSLKTRLLTASRDCDPDTLFNDVVEEIKLLDDGDGVLVLTDLYGSTPSNIARKISAKNNVAAVSGINLSMLIRLLNYPKESLEALADKAVSGGHEGIVRIDEQ